MAVQLFVSVQGVVALRRNWKQEGKMCLVVYGILMEQVPFTVQA